MFVDVDPATQVLLQPLAVPRHGSRMFPQKAPLNAISAKISIQPASTEIAATPAAPVVGTVSTP